MRRRLTQFSGFGSQFDVEGGGGPPNILPTVPLLGTYTFVDVTALTVPFPAGYATDDIGLLIRESTNNPGATPAGWTALTPRGVGTASAIGSARCETWWKRLTVASETNPTFIAETTHQSGIIIIIRGCPNSSVPVMSEAGLANNPGANPTSFAALTSTLNDSLWVEIAARTNDTIVTPQFTTETNASLTGLTKILDTGSNLADGGGIAIFTGSKVFAGAAAATTVTATDFTQNIGRQSVVFRPTPF